MSALLPVTRQRRNAYPSRVITRLVAAAQRRMLLVIALEQLAFVGCVFLAGFIVALLFGMAARTVLLLAIATTSAVVFACWRIRKNLPNCYSTAQTLDHHFRLHDTLSTAWFLITQPAPAKRSGSSLLPIQQAEAFAPQVEPSSVFPWRGGKLWAVSLLLAVAAGLLFRERYLVLHTLDLHPPLIALQFAPFLERVETALAIKEKNDLKSEAEQARKDASTNLGDKQANRAENPEQIPLPPPTAKPDTSESGGTNNSVNGEQARGLAAGKPQSEASTGAKNGNPATPSGTEDLSAARQEHAADTRSSQKSAAQEQQPSPKQPATSGLMNKLKDALSSMMARMSSPNAGQKAGNPEDPSARQGQNGQQPANSAQQSASQQANSSQNQSASEATSNSEANAESGQKAATAQSRNSSHSQQTGAESHSGVGSQDGDKQLREAEQQQAMGKLAEILGKRSAALTGEMTVETPSGNQKLKTAYTNEQGHHSDLGGEINRNEVPARYRRFIEDYMEQVRKTQNPPAAERPAK